MGDGQAPPSSPTGMLVLFRKEAVDTVGGYDVHYRRHHEDWDICRRMKEFGWESHYVAVSACISIQEDSLRSLAIKQLRDRRLVFSNRGLADSPLRSSQQVDSYTSWKKRGERSALPSSRGFGHLGFRTLDRHISHAPGDRRGATGRPGNAIL